MNKLVLELQTAEKKMKINLQTSCEDTIYKAVDCSFDFMNQGLAMEDPLDYVDDAEMLRGAAEPEPSLPEVTPTAEKKPVDELKVVEEKPELPLPKVESRARALPLLSGRENSTPVYSSSYEEQRKLNNQKHSGIKEINGRILYQTHYICPSCGHKGKRFLAPDEHIVNCHECNQKMKKEAAVEGSYLERDLWGNFFIARQGLL